MSVWHDPKGRQIVDGHGKISGRLDGPPDPTGETVGERIECGACSGTIPTHWDNHGVGHRVPYSKRHSCPVVQR